ncbi:DUF2510 domain-containing protein [Solirubrobacter phytolaccae]|uniref:DUF2510 domain-containing protein n=1 Tax=Solirubrobacter phytolaccae TaxID=1404360 RepID=A0A9X3SI90_9ACTN|nr:DUF2510 domain-containing protein [Solirubrobacter phytolaccae]MDA0184037.1 DUF2510 domain-containing protein [Solirubrobacter phytolaccae]
MRGAKGKWLVIVVVALAGAAGGAYLGNEAAPDVTGVIACLAAAGFALGGLLGVLVSGWWRPPPKPAKASPPAPPAAPPRPAPEATPEPVVAAPAAPAAPPPAPEPPPPPENEEPGWYPDHTGARRYWDGERWTESLWRDRAPRTRKR